MHPRGREVLRREAKQGRIGSAKLHQEPLEPAFAFLDVSERNEAGDTVPEHSCQPMAGECFRNPAAPAARPAYEDMHDSLRLSRPTGARASVFRAIARERRQTRTRVARESSSRVKAAKSSAGRGLA